MTRSHIIGAVVLTITVVGAHHNLSYVSCCAILLTIWLPFQAKTCSTNCHDNQIKECKVRFRHILGLVLSIFG